MPRTSYVQIKGKLREIKSDGSVDVDGDVYIRNGWSWIPADSLHGVGSMVLPDIQPFVSTVDGSVVLGRASLREHNRRHNVTNVADYKETWAKAQAQREAAFKGELRDSSLRETLARETYRRT